MRARFGDLRQDLLYHGRLHKPATGDWAWCQYAAATAGVKIPIHMDADDEDIKNEEGEEPPQQEHGPQKHPGEEQPQVQQPDEVWMDEAENIAPNKQLPAPEGESEAERGRTDPESNLVNGVGAG